MGVAAHRLDGELNREHAAASQAHLGPTVRVDAALLPDRAVTLQQRQMIADELGDVRTADLFLPFYDERDATGKLPAVGITDRVDRGQTRDELAFVVLGAARV